MSEKYLRGKIVFINNAAETATIEYITNNKIKKIPNAHNKIKFLSMLKVKLRKRKKRVLKSIKHRRIRR